MTVPDPIGPAPETRSPTFLWLLFGCAAAPLAWTGQLVANYAVTAYGCYPADHPVMPASTGGLLAMVIVFDVLALALCGTGGLVSWRGWQRARHDGGRNRFLALWGVMSSLWFFAAILFNAIASFVPPCAS